MIRNTKKKRVRDNEHTVYPASSVNGENVICVCDLSHHKDSKCWVLHTKSAIYLQSYNTIVSKYYEKDGENRIIESKHSTTTSRQQTWFAHECNCRNRKVVESVIGE